MGWLWVAAIPMFVGMLIARRWVHSRWLDGQLSAKQAAGLSVAVFYGPLLVVALAGLVVTGSEFNVGGLALTVAGIGLVAAWGVALRVAVFQYMEQHGVRDVINRQRRGRE